MNNDIQKEVSDRISIIQESIQNMGKMNKYLPVLAGTLAELQDLRDWIGNRKVNASKHDQGILIKPLSQQVNDLLYQKLIEYTALEKKNNKEGRDLKDVIDLLIEGINALENNNT